MPELESTDFTPGRAVDLAIGVRRLVAANGGAMTGPGTNTYLLGRERVVVLDPGPAIDGQVEAIVRAVGTATVTAIVVTHTHTDHSPAAMALAQRWGVPTVGRLADFPTFQDPTFKADRVVNDGDRVDTDIGPLVAVTTPGHASNHICWHLSELGYVCTGDHVLGTVSPVIIHPDGDLADYLDSLRKVAALRPRALLPGHGPAVTEPNSTIERLIAHRLLREQRVLAALAVGRACRVDAMLPDVYADVPPALHSMARYTLMAHLVKLQRDGRVVRESDDLWVAT
jgi:glyoxylase-like metal-dependent hydrolase (beta-lactamase superfamily II)